MNSIKVIKIIAVMMLIVVSITANAQRTNSILDEWKDEDHPEKRIEITSQNGENIGKSINTTKPAENGKTVFKDLRWSESSKTYKEILINPDNGDEFKIEIKMFGIDRFKFTAGKLNFTKIFTFNRIPQ
jgi:hypothetical protein